MTAPTHVSIAGLAYAAGCAFLDQPPSWAGGVAVAGGALLPDIDTPNSLVGRPLWFLSSWLERRFGHRTVTHSFFGFVFFLLLSFPFFLFVSPIVWAGLGLGYFTHLLGDMWTKSGVQFYWPLSLWGVFPGKERYRLRTGSKVESAVLLMSLCASAAVLPVSLAGSSRTLHYVTGSVSGAVRDYYEYGPAYRTYLEVDGVLRGSERALKGRFPVVGGVGRDSLLIDVDGELLIVGSGPDRHVKPRRLWLEKGERVVRYEQLLELDGRQLAELASLEGKSHRLFGRLVHVGDVGIPSEPWRFGTVRLEGRELVLDYATYDELSALGLEDVVVLGSQVRVVRELPPKTRYVPLSLVGSVSGAVVLEFSVSTASDILVAPGDRVEAGQLLAANQRKVRRLTVIEAEIDSRRRLRVEGSTRTASGLVVLEDRAAIHRARLSELERIAEAYREYEDFKVDVAEIEKKIAEIELELAAVRLAADETRSRDASSQIRYEQDVSRLAAEAADLRGDSYLRAPFDGRIGSLTISGARTVVTLLRDE